MKNKPKLADIAKVCGVGVSTVSRVLNNVEKQFSVKPEIRSRILSVAKELNYSPNYAAKTLRSQKNNLVLIYGYRLEWSVYNGLYMQMLRHAVSVLGENGYETHIVLQSENSDALMPMMMDGALVITNENQTIIQELTDKGISYVTLNDIAGEDSSWVATDDKAGMNTALEHLYDLGHRKIVYCADHEELLHQGHHSLKDRYDAYLDFMSGKGLVPQSELAFTSTAGEILKDKIVKTDRATAVVTYDQHIAARLMNMLAADNISVPEEMSVICFGDIYDKTNQSPIVTAMRIPAEDMGKKAASILLQKMTDHTFNDHQIFPEQLIPRKTTGRVRNEE